MDALRAWSPRGIADDAGAAPFFLYLALQAVHSPLQVDERWIESGGCEQATANHDRQKLCGMVHEADHHVGSLVGELRARGDWPSTVFVFLSDNGASTSFGGSNRPLRGEKGQYWEGGVRAPALLAGGHTEHALQAAGGRAYVSRALMHVTDVTATLLAVRWRLAGRARAPRPRRRGPVGRARRGRRAGRQVQERCRRGDRRGRRGALGAAHQRELGAVRRRRRDSVWPVQVHGNARAERGRHLLAHARVVQTHRAADFAASHGWLKALREQIWEEGGNDVGTYLFDIDANPYEEARDATVPCDDGAPYEACHSLLDLPSDAPVSAAQVEAWARAEDDARARLRAYAADAARSSTQFEYDGALVDPALFNGSLGVPWRDADNVPFAMVAGLRPADEPLATIAKLPRRARCTRRRRQLLTRRPTSACVPRCLSSARSPSNVLATSAVVLVTGRSRWRRAPRSPRATPSPRIRV